MYKMKIIGMCILLLAVYLYQKVPAPNPAHAEKRTTSQTETAALPGKLASQHISIEKVSNKNSLPQEALDATTADNGDNASVEVVAQPASIAVLVNKYNELPATYRPKDLVMTQIPFIPSTPRARREMRRSAAAAVEKLFAAAKKQGVHLLGVSAYRSYASQESLFNTYVQEDGYSSASSFSALPGTSEHETGLAIDVTEGNGKCAADDCFGKTKEAKWLQKHAADYGFIIRYPKGKEEITGYKYEPWHLRYVGKTIAKIIMTNGITLEEYYDTVPVNGNKQYLTFAH